MTRAKWQAILFDLDGTLLDTAPDFVTSTKLLLQTQGITEVDESVIRNAVSNGSKGIIQTVFNLPDDDPQLEPLRLQLVEIYFDKLHELTQPFPGITETLAELEKHQIPWGIVTNKPSRYTDAILERLPFHYPPAAVVCPDHVVHTKPHPDPILAACRILQVMPQQTVYIGDHLRDIEAGKAAGTATIAAAYGYIHNEDPADWGADFQVASAQQITGLLFDDPCY